MSGGFEKETKTSTAKSLVGALLALGSGLVFMFVALVAVTSSSRKVQPDPSAGALIRSLTTDFVAYQAGSLQVSKDQKSIRLRLLDGSAEVAYKVLGDSGEITRESDGVSQKVAKLSGARFESTAGLLWLHWQAADGQAKTTWAVNRWADKGKSS